MNVFAWSQHNFRISPSSRQQVKHRITKDVILAIYLEYDMSETASIGLGKIPYQLMEGTI